MAVNGMMAERRPWWVDAANTLGPTNLLVLAFAGFIMWTLASSLARLDVMVRDHVVENHEQRLYFWQICINTAPSELSRQGCGERPDRPRRTE